MKVMRRRREFANRAQRKKMELRLRVFPRGFGARDRALPKVNKDLHNGHSTNDVKYNDYRI